MDGPEGAPGLPAFYAGETFRLQVKFTERYPLEPPEVVFVPPHTPVHPHVYSNGHICLGGRRAREGVCLCAAWA